MSNDQYPMGKKAFPVNGKVVGILAALLVGICGAVVAVDIASPRDRTVPATAPATMAVATTRGGGL